MRTKTLLLTAALAAIGVTSSMAQVYSVNAVGYVNLNIPKGFSMIANQFTQPSYAVSALIPNPAPGTTVYKFSNPGGYTLNTFDEFDLVWGDPNMTLPLGYGFFVLAPAPFTQTFVGEVPQGTLTTATPKGFTMVASQVPQAGTISQLGYAGEPGDTIYKFSNASGYSIYSFDEFDLVWTRNGAAEEPSLGVGEGFFLLKSPTTVKTSWSRTFSVN
jgi:hypothetical protein